MTRMVGISQGLPSCGITCGIRALECAEPSVHYTTLTKAITCAAQGATATGTTVPVCDTDRPLQIRNWIGFLCTCNRVLDLTNVEVVIEIRYVPAAIVYRGIDATTPTALTFTYQIDNYFMAIFKANLDDDYYQMALNYLTASGNYSITFKTYSNSCIIMLVY